MSLQPAKFEDKVVAPKEFNQFTLARFKAMYSMLFAQGFSSELRQAAIRTILGHGAHQDGTHYHMKTPGGLHPVHIAFNPPDDDKVFSHTELVKASISDTFDVLSQHSHFYDVYIAVFARLPC
jgi:hypothetical protein